MDVIAITFGAFGGHHAASATSEQVSAANAVGGRITLTQRELGEIIGMTRESINKQLRAWEERNWIRLQRGSVVVLDPAALSALICPDLADAA